jgi:hypothetical protein
VFAASTQPTVTICSSIFGKTNSGHRRGASVLVAKSRRVGNDGASGRIETNHDREIKKKAPRPGIQCILSPSRTATEITTEFRLSQKLQALRERVKELERQIAARKREIEAELAKLTPRQRAFLEARWAERDPTQPLN